MPNDHDPFRPDPTTLRPRPGAGRRTSADTFRPQTAAHPIPSDVEPLSAATRKFLGIGLSPLVRASSSLLLLSARVRETRSPMDVGGLRTHALEEIRRFEEQARSLGVSNETVLAARYALCAGLDEAVLSTPWGNQSEWAQHPLLVVLHREAWGGEKFFDMLDGISKDPATHLDLMELQHLIALGFEGKYHIQERGRERLQTVQDELYTKIRQYRRRADRELSPQWRGLEDRRSPLLRLLPWWIVGLAALALLAMTFAAYYTSLAKRASPVHAELAKVGVEDFSTARPAGPVKGPTLKQLLASDERLGTLSVEENGGRTRVTLLARDLFPSGSATVNPDLHATLRRLTAALNSVPGRVLVVGHTDDQPIKSLRYQDNFELSRERALSVVNLLQQGIDNRARLSGRGVGSTEPRYRPESEPENRRRNRRVEIIHIRD